MIEGRTCQPSHYFVLEISTLLVGCWGKLEQDVMLLQAHYVECMVFFKKTIIIMKPRCCCAQNLPQSDCIYGTFIFSQGSSAVTDGSSLRTIAYTYTTGVKSVYVCVCESVHVYVDVAV